MTGTEEYGTKKCTLGEAERLCNFGKWDEADFGNCCEERCGALTGSQLRA